MKKFFLIIISFFILFSFLFSAEDIMYDIVDISTTSWDKTFKQNLKTLVERVEFKNRFGIKLVGDLYVPGNIKEGESYIGIAIAGPYGAVKEQASGLYAQELASRGFITLAFDPSFTGESGGEPRAVSSPDINAEDFMASVDFLSNIKSVDPNKIAIIGICGFGGYALYANVSDTRIKATIASTMYDMPRVLANGYDDIMTDDDKYRMKQELCNQRTKDFLQGEYDKVQTLPESLRGDEPDYVKDYYNYYKLRRGYHRRSINSTGGWTKANPLNIINSNLFTHVRDIKNAVLLVHGERAHSRYFSENVFGRLRGDNKEFFLVKDATHVDLYDNMEKIPFDKMEKFLKKHLNQNNEQNY